MNKRDAEVKFQQADTLFREGSFPQALALLNELGAVYVDKKNIMYAQAKCLRELGHSQQAWELCNRIMSLHHAPRAQRLKEDIENETTAAEVASAGQMTPAGSTHDSPVPVSLFDEIETPAEMLPSSSGETNAAAGPKGIGGWLILLAFVLLITPLLYALKIVFRELPMFINGRWIDYMTEGSAAYAPTRGVLAAIRALGSGALFCASVVLILLFFTKKRLFPSSYIGFRLIALAFVVIDMVVFGLILNGLQSIMPLDIIQVFVQTVLTALWIAYLITSKRVKATFVN